MEGKLGRAISQGVHNVASKGDRWLVRREVKNLAYSTGKYDDSFSGDYLPVEIIQGTVHGQKVHLRVTHVYANQLIEGVAGGLLAENNPDEAFNAFFKYRRALMELDRVS